MTSKKMRFVYPLKNSKLLQAFSRRAFLAALASILMIAPARASGDDVRWVGTWSAAMQAPFPGATPAKFSNLTLRQIVRVTIGGDVVRVRFSNATGSDSVTIGAASIGVRSTGASVRAGTLRTLTFGGETSITMPPGAVAITDGVRLDVAAQDDLAISLYLPRSSAQTTMLSLAHQTNYQSPPGDFTAATAMTAAATNTTWFWLSGVEVLAGGDARAIVAFGDSITEGFNSTTDANARWPDVLARRLLARGGTRNVSVLNEAISGNRVLNDVIGPNAQKRIDRDALTQGGAAYVIVLEGTNDMGFSQFPPGFFGPGVSLANVSAAEIIAGYKQIIRRAHQAGAKVYGGTVLPFEGAFYYDAAVEPKRAALNAFIRGGGWFDGVIDFDAATRDPAHPTRMLPAYDSGDHLHPNDAGYAAMGNAVDLGLFSAGED
jgi:lysophospholipase L1-like esterase